jgi:hypothetical protein
MSNMGEEEVMYGPPIPVAEHIRGRANFLRGTFELAEEFLELPMIQHGHSPEADHRINLLLAVMYTFHTEVPREELVEHLEAWRNSEDVLLEGDDPIHYLGTKENLSDKLWLEVAMNVLPGKGYRTVTDKKAKELMKILEGLFADTERDYADFSWRSMDQDEE